MKGKTVKWISYLLAFIMIFSDLMCYSTLTVLAEEIPCEAGMEDLTEGTEEERIVETESEKEEVAEETEREEEEVAEETESEKEEVAEETEREEEEVAEEAEREEEEVIEETECTEEIGILTEISELEQEVVSEDGFILKFQEDFEGESLNTDYWSYVTYEPGRVNNELQEYTDSPNNIFVSGGILTIQANKEIRDGEDYYTSGRITTQDKFDFKYGRIEARIKVPEATGLLPAFWMMPSDENIYGQWPKSGEIDIMEILGQQTDTVYGTIHYGNPHKQSHEKYTLADGVKFSDDFHIFSVEWEPGMVTYYVDGIKYHEVNTWYTKEEGEDEITFPAPFDQNFYLIFNLAVGGDWPGNPDDTFSSEGEQLLVDWVKVWQKEFYDENVEKPEVYYREPDAEGNYIVNGDFSVEEDLFDARDWSFLLDEGGKGKATISDHMLSINTDEDGIGTQLYAVQLVQPQLPMKKGNTYKLTFEARAAEERTMVVDVSAPDNGWVRYLEDTSVQLGTEWEEYEYFFTMTYDSDVNGRLEFNLGNQNSTAQVQIRNVKLTVSSVSENDEEKSIRADGNYVYNGAFEIGTDRLKYWEIENTAEQAAVSVTNDNGERWLKVEVADKVSPDQIVIKQTGLALLPEKEYKLCLDAYGDVPKSIQLKVAGQTFEIELTSEADKYEYIFQTPAGLNNTDLEMYLGNAGITYIDNIVIKENVMLLNGDFNNNLVGWKYFTDSTIREDVTVGVVSEDGNNVLQYSISDTGNQDWRIQLKQDNILLEKGKKYKLSFKAKSDIDRKLKYALKKDRTTDNKWTSYTGTDIVELTNEYKEYSKTFTMSYDTDKAAILNVSLGAVEDVQIQQAHHIWMDDFVLVEVENEETNPENENPAELIKNGNFTRGNFGWRTVISEDEYAEVRFENNSAVFEIADTGTENGNIQLKQSGLNLEIGQEYIVKLIIRAENSRYIKYRCMGGKDTGYKWYSGKTVRLPAGEETEVTYTFKMGDAYGVTESDSNANFVLSLGKMNEEEETAAGKVTVTFVSIVLKEGGTENPEETETESEEETETESPEEKETESAEETETEGTEETESAEETETESTEETETESAEETETESAEETETESPEESETESPEEPETEVPDSPGIQEGLRVIDINQQTYSGKAMKPDVLVYDGAVKLQEKTDYTLSFKNNKNVGIATVTVKGKGNYDGKDTVSFSIVPKSISDDDVIINYKDALIETNKNQKAFQKITYNGAKLGSKDYKVEYYRYEDGVVPKGAKPLKQIKAAGDYKMVITGLHNPKTNKGNFTGTVEKDIKVYEKNSVVDISRLTIKIGGKKSGYSVVCDGTRQKPSVEVIAKGKVIDSTNYTVEWEDDLVSAGTKKVVISGKAEKGYIGTVTKTFKITATNLSNVAKIDTVKWLAKVNVDVQTGRAVQPENMLIAKKANSGLRLKEGTDYTVTYRGNEKAGKATVIYTGIGKYKGTIKKTFTVNAVELFTQNEPVAGVVVEGITDAKGNSVASIFHQKGSRLDITVSINGKVLKEGVDYKVTYKRNKAVTTGKMKENQKPQVIIQGLKAYKGKLTKSFVIIPASLEDMNMTVKDVAYQKKKGKYVSVPELTDAGGAKLKVNRDYTLTYYLIDGEKQTKLDKKKDVVGVYSKVKVVATAKSANYRDSREAVYTVTVQDIAKAKVVVKSKQYTGKEITLTAEDFTTIRIGKTNLKEGVHYIIVADSYKNNIKQGTASVTIRGIGDYGGTKKVNYKITRRAMVWGQNLFKW